MNKKHFNWLFAAALLFSLTLSVTSCKDDDNDTNSTQKQEQEAQEEASKFWRVVGQLISVDDATEDYEGKIFEPTYGLEDETNPLTRIVSVNDMQSAAQWFADLIDAKDINENTESYNWSDPEIGTMTYTKGGTPENWATVDVDIKAVPHLKKIVYRVGGIGENGTVKGKAYYRFGDVISRQVEVVYNTKKNGDQRGTITEYWICVRPSFGPEDKGDSHWVCVNTVSDKNYKYYKGSNKTEYWLPYALKYDKKNTQNFAEMLYAICFPEQWYTNANENHIDKLFGFSGVPIFGDFTKNYLQYHNQYFWQNVQLGWEKTHVVEKALNLPSLTNLVETIQRNGIRVLYNGYHWVFLTSWECELYEAIFTNGTAKEELNMHHLELKEHDKDMRDIKFDVREMGQKFDNYAAYFGNDGKYRWTIRCATGKELAKNGKYDPQQQINGVTDVYRYYRDVVNTTDLQEDPEITKESNTTVKNVLDGCGTYMIGDVVQDEEGSRWFCIAGSPKSSLYYPNHPDNKATFITFDNIKVQGEKATNIINEKEMTDVAAKLALYYNLLSTEKPTSGIQLTLDNLGKIGNHILTYTGVDLRKIYMVKDSTWHFQKYSTKTWYDSNSQSVVFNLAYNDGMSNKQPIARVIADNTFAGTKRTESIAKSGKKYSDWQYRFYKHYEVFDPSRMNGLDEDMESVGMTLWQTPWAISQDKMYLGDVASQDMVNKYAAADKWVRLSQPVTGGYIIPGVPRAQAEISVSPQDYIWKNGAPTTSKTSIFNEPVLFVRVMYVEDNGGKVPNNMSVDGKPLTIVHMLDDQFSYMLGYQGRWARDVYEYSNGNVYMWVDNQQTNMVPEWPEPKYKDN